MFIGHIKIAWRYIKFYSKAKTIYDIHNPVLFEFATHTVENSCACSDFALLEGLRKELLQNNEVIDIEDLGAGSLNNSSNSRKIKTIAKTSLSSPYYCRLLYNITRYYKPQVMLELGTSLGLSALYQAKGNYDGILHSIEGSQSVYDFAKRFIENQNQDNINLIHGSFEDNLKTVLKNTDTLDYAFLDGNHRYQATIDYFNHCLEKSINGSILVFDDIYWSQGMMKAWQEIKEHPKVHITLDMFFIGVVFIKDDVMNDVHLKLVPKKYKPWRLGFFG